MFWFILSNQCSFQIHLEQSKQLIAVAERDLQGCEEYDGDNPDVEARLPSKEVGDGTGRGLGCEKKILQRPEHKGSQDKADHPKRVQVRHVVTNPTNPIVLSDKSVFELGVIVTPLTAACQIGIRLKNRICIEEVNVFYSTWI